MNRIFPVTAGLFKLAISIFSLVFVCTLNAAILSGSIKDKSDSPIVGASTQLFKVENASLVQVENIIQVGDDGSFSWTVDDGSYVVRAFFNATDVSLEGAPNSVIVQSEDFLVQGDTSKEMVMNFFMLSGKVVDENQIGIAQVDLQTNKAWSGPEVGPAGFLAQYSINHSNSSNVTDENGQYALLLFSTDTCIASGFFNNNDDCLYDINYLPPSESGFADITELDYSVSNDQILNKELSISDQTAPKNIVSPYLRYVTDTTATIEWMTDEVTTGIVELSGIDSFESSELRTFHSVAISGLNAATEYNAQVNSSDRQANLSSAASVVFTTESLPDTQPPLYSKQPQVLSISSDQMSIEFCANEPVTGTLSVGTNDYVIAELATCHSLNVTQLEANKSYTVVASISDGNANGPVLSSVGQVTTLPAFDWQSPSIISGPSVVDVSNSAAVVVWTTDEPTTSDISYNNGTQYQVQKDEQLTSQHSVILSNLSADTVYHLAVSSKDASGNGPGISNSVEFRTKLDPDNNSPQIIGRPMVQDVTDKSAIISWRTDESSSTMVLFGTQANNLNRVEASANFTTQHQLALSGLSAESDYFYQVQSVDLAGNLTSSSIASFSTFASYDGSELQILSGPIVERVSGNSITLSWLTNQNSDSRLVCESSNGDSQVNRLDLVKNHFITLTGLQFNTAYRCIVYSTDINGQIVSAVQSLVSTDEVDNTAPQCEANTSMVDGYEDYADLTWQSNELASASVKYRIKDQQDWTYQTSSEIGLDGYLRLDGLQSNSVYEQQLSLTDVVGNSVDCDIAEFTTSATSVVPEPVFSLQPQVSEIGNYSAQVNWQTELVSNGIVRYGLSSDAMNFVEADPSFSTSHQLTLSGLQPSTTYYLQVEASNTNGDLLLSDVISFVTTALAENEINPAKIITGPFVTNITDVTAIVEWQTDKAANSRVEITNGDTFINQALTTSHAVFLTNLTPATDYFSLVSSTDEYNNTSAAKPADFRTLDLADGKLPRFVNGPNAIAFDYDRFTVTFCADEPVTAIVSIDATDYALNSANVCHQLEVTELTANTTYTVVVQITDMAGNGPVFSSPISATTLADLDIAQPTITGPTVSDITDSSAIVRWTTNEYATSGVEYTNGLTNNRLDDATLVVEHVMYLSNLTAATTYTLTANSSDAFGNGPTISQPVEFTTLALPDTKAPTLISGPFVEQITSHSALVIWTTDEAATHLVKLGLANNNLDREFSVEGLASNHQVPLTDLTADTVYYFQVVSSDLASNTYASSVLSFRTLKETETAPVLKIIAGPDVENADIDSLTVSWSTNLVSDSRLVCQAEQKVNSVSGMNSLATVNTVAADKAIENQYIVLLKDRFADDNSQAFFELSASERRSKLTFTSNSIASKVNAKVVRQFSNKVNGFVLNMKAQQLELLRQDQRILMIEQDQMMSISATQNNATWGLDRIDQADLPLSNSYTYTPDGSGVNTYIIDTGVLTSHADFAGRAFSGWDFVDNDSDASDCHGHGTHVAGTTAGATWGVAKNANITAIRVLGCSGSGSNSGVIAGVDWVAANATLPAVANMSLGGGNSPILDAAVNRAIDAGITFVVAAGNSNINACSGSPNKVPAAITVASSTINDSRSSFSNWGSCVDLFAPGSDITSTWSNGGIHTISGTSMAAPHVAGAAALFLQAYPNSSPAEVASGLEAFAIENKISNPNGSPNLLLNIEFDSGTILPDPPEDPEPEKITFEVSSDAMVTEHLLTLAGLNASTIYSCTVHSKDINNNKVSADLRGTTTDIPDVTPPACVNTTQVDPFVDSALVSWQADELVTAVVNYRQVGEVDRIQLATLSPAKSDALLLNDLLPETLYQQQVSLIDVAGNQTDCGEGNFQTLAPESTPVAEFKVQPVISDITESSASVSWQTQQPSSANVRFGQVKTALEQNQPDDQFLSSHKVDLQNLSANTVYYVQVDAFNILGELTSSEIVNFTTAHIEQDFDQDGVPNHLDNCQFTVNPEQLDSDGNGIGDACDEVIVPDTDFDDDGILDDVDNCPVDPNSDQLDQDSDGIGDVCDAPVGSDNDFDDDNILDDVDNCPETANSDQQDSDNNGIGDACDVPIIITPPPPVDLVGINLRGTVTAEGQPIAGVVMALYNSQQQLVATLTTESDGNYLFEFLTPGNYFIGVTPPAETGFSSLPLQPVSINDRDVVHLITLINDGVKLSGFLRDSQARVIDSVDVSLHLQTTGVQVGNAVKTDSNGYFEFFVAPGNYQLKPSIDVFNPAQQPMAMPNYPVADFATILHAPQNIQLTEDLELDVVLPFALLSGQTLDHLGQPVAGVGLSINHQFATLQKDFYLENYATDSLSNAISDDNGNFEFAVFTEQEFDIQLLPPANRLDLAVTTVSNYSLTADATESFNLVEGVSLSGTLQDTSGRVIDNTKITLHDQQTGVQIGAPVFTDANGLYLFKVAAGSYKLKPHLNPFGIGEGQRPSYPLPDYASVLFAQQQVDVSGATVQDIILPMAILSGTVTDDIGTPVANTRVTISHIEDREVAGFDTSYFLESRGQSLLTHAKSDANGDFSIALFIDQAMNITFIPVENQRDVGATLYADYVITADTSDTFSLQQSYRLSGYLKDAQGNNVDNTLITVHNESDNQLADVASMTNSQGYFEFRVAAGEYKLRPYLQPANQVNNQTVLSNYPVPDFAAVYYLPNSVSVASDTELDLTLPMSILSGQTLDANGVEVAGVKLKVDHSYAENSVSYYLENSGEFDSSHAISDENGEFAFSLFTNQTTDVSVNPPLGSGFAITNVSHNLDQQTSENVYLPHVDSPPKIIYGPEVIRISDRSAIIVWRTDKPAKGIIELSNGRTVNVDRLTTYNCILLWDLQPNTEYTATVQAVDKDDQTSDTKTTNFITKGSPNIKLPEFVNGPVVSNITENQFEISFCANGPVTATITMGEELFSLEQLDVCHRIVIDGRTPNTLYEFVVAITDPSGNGPTNSQPLEATTLPLADTTAPEISLLPYVIDITDTQATVIWKTDEESNSGVSYNNGTQYHVVTESDFVYEHNIQLTDLLPETEYSLIVSSTDSVGNGPTLSQPVSFTTLATQDTAAPIIIGSPLIQNITHQSVVIRWRTDESSTTAVVFGTDPNQLVDIESNGESLKTKHNMAITGLEADTVYYFRVQSQDAAGNLVSSELMSFKTKVRGHQGAPHFMKKVVVERVTATSVTVAWVTDVNADGRLVCRLGQSESLQKSDAKRVKKHRLTLTGLSANSSYRCIVYSTDHKGYSASFEIEADVETVSQSAESAQSKQRPSSLFDSFISMLSGESKAERKLPLNQPMIQAPVVTQAEVINGYGNLATLTLSANELTSLLIQYREVGESVWRPTGNLELAVNHVSIVPDLMANRNYELQYTLTNLSSESLISEIKTFNSASVSELIVPSFVASPEISDIGESTALVSWQTNDFAFAQINFGTSESELLEKEANAELTQNHEVTLVRLRPATIYYVQVTLFNLAGESVLSDVASFVTSALNATDDSDSDGMTDQWEISHGLDPQDASDSGLDQDGDGLTNREEFLADSDPNNSDSDSDGIPDGWEVDHGLDPNDASDANQDRDGDGESNLDEYLNSNDNQAPMIELSAEVSIDSSGILTAVPNNNIVATDNIDGDVAVNLVGDTHRLPGLHMIDWVAEDAAGNRTIATQRLKIKPQVLLASGASTGENKIIEIPVRLSGDAAEYPVMIPFSMAGDADVSDYQMLASTTQNYEVVANQLVIYQGHSGVIRIEILDDSVSEIDEQLLINLATPENAVLLGNSQYQVVITSANLAPQASLRAVQVEQLRTTVTRDGGPVTIEVAVLDGNAEDTHQVEWVSADNAQISIDSETNALTLDPAALALGIYSKTVTVTDNGQPNLSHSQTIYLNVIEAAPNLSSGNDSDGDGINDLEEGMQDSDLDGVPDYLDPLNQVNLLQQQFGSQQVTGSYMMQVEAGLHLALGNIAIASQSGSLISPQDLQSSEAFLTHGDDSQYNQVGGLNDFVVSGLQAEGDSVRVVIPQQQAIPEQAVYRKLHANNGWFSFVMDSNNQLYSSPDSQGACPSADDDSYVEGLNAGDWCVLMLIEDGGPNDVDNSINGRIVDPGGVSSPLALSAVSIASVSKVVEGDNISLTATIVDNGNQIVSYQWQQTAGATVTILNSDELTASVNNIAQGSYTFSLNITDGLGRTSSDQVSINVAAKTNPPVVEESSGGGGGSIHLAWLLLFGLISISRIKIKRD